MQNRFKLAIGGLSVSAVAASVALTGGTSAYFYDLEQSQDNSISACSLDISQDVARVENLSSANSQAQFTTTQQANQNNQFVFSHLQPGDKFQVRVDVVNVGECAGELYSDVDHHSSNDNGVTEPEATAGDATDGVGGGELQSVMTVNTLGRIQRGGSNIDSFTSDMSLGDWAVALIHTDAAEFEPGDVARYYYTFEVPNGGRGAENEIMTDSYTFDLNYALAQLGAGNGGDLDTTRN